MDFTVQDLSKIQDDFPQKRDCLKSIKEYLSKKKETKVCALFGLRRTGKTVLMQQAFLSLPESEKEKSVFLICNKNTDFYNVISFIKNSIEEGKKYFFIDEITYAKNFQNLAEVLSDNFVSNYNAKIILTGTDSLGLSLPSHSNLYDRIEMIHTTYTSFPEFSRITGNKSIDYYLKHGSTLSDISPFESFSSSSEYIETSIVENFLNSLEKSEGIKAYPPVLTELYDNSDLENAIQRIINHYSQTITIRALQKQFELAPLKDGLDVFSKRSDGDLEIKRKIDVNSVTEKVKKLLKIGSFSTVITEEHLLQIKEFLTEMDVITCIPVVTSCNDKKQSISLEMITHPGMYHANLKYTINMLQNDDSWMPGVSQEKKEMFLKAVYETAAGKIQENFIIADVYKLLGTKENVLFDFDYQPVNRWYVSKYAANVKGRDEEVDLIIFDKKEKNCFLFEIIHTKNVTPEQSLHLESQDFIEQINVNFGEISGRAVLYNGPNNSELKVPRINVSDFLIDIYLHNSDKNYSISDTLQRLIKSQNKHIHNRGELGE